MSRPKKSKCKFKAGDIVRNKNTNVLHMYVTKYNEIGFIHLLGIHEEKQFESRPYHQIYTWQPEHNDQHEFIMNIYPVLQTICDNTLPEIYGNLHVHSD